VITQFQKCSEPEENKSAAARVLWLAMTSQPVILKTHTAFHRESLDRNHKHILEPQG